MEIYIEDPDLGTLGRTGRILRYLSGSLGGGMAGKIVELRAALLAQGAMCLVHPYW